MRAPGLNSLLPGLSTLLVVLLLVSCGPSQEEIRIGALQHFNRGNRHFKENNLKAAIAEYQLAIAGDETRAEYHYNLGLAYYALVLYERAIEAYSAAIRHQPDFSEAWYNLSLALDKIGETEQAFMAYEKYRLLNRQLPESTATEGKQPSTPEKPK